MPISRYRLPDRDKDGVRYTYPNRKCTDCAKYPCFIGIDKSVCDFAKYGCRNYKD